VRALIDAMNSFDVADLIDRYYDSSLVHGFALGVHGNYVDLYRSQFGVSIPVNEILESGKSPAAWSEECLKGELPPGLSPIYIVIYVDITPDDFRNRYPVPQISAAGRLVLVEQKGRFVDTADRAQHRPIKGGISVGNAALKLSGTLGGYLKLTSTGELFVLSCNHVLYDASGTDVVQQGISDGGNNASAIIGSRADYVPLDLPTRFSYAAPYNVTDVALAKIDSGVRIDPDIRLVGQVNLWASKNAVNLGDDVVFVGKESDRKEARVFRFIARLKIHIQNKVYNFGEVFEIEPRRHLYFGKLSGNGDSGSWIIREVDPQNKELYGLLFAGESTGKNSICCFIENVFDKLGNKGFDLA